MWFAVLTTLLALVSGDVIEFTQCGCELGMFPVSGDECTIQGSLFPSNNQTCGDRDFFGFPINPGVRVTPNTIIEGATIPASVINSQVFAISVFIQVLDNLPENPDATSILRLEDPEGEVFYEFSIQEDGTFLRTTPFGDSGTSGGLLDPTGPGELQVFFATDGFQETSAVTAEELLSSSTGQVNIPFNLQQDLTIKVMDNGEGDFFPIVVNKLVVTNVVENLEEAQFPAFDDGSLIILPVIDEAVTFDAVEGEKTVIDVTSFLSFDLEGIIFLLIDTLTGEVDSTNFENTGVFTYEPEGDFSPLEVAFFNYGFGECIRFFTPIAVNVEESNEANVGAIVGGVFGAIIGIALTAGLIFFFINKSNKSEDIPQPSI